MCASGWSGLATRSGRSRYRGIPGANGVIQGCYDSGGNLKVVGTQCPEGLHRAAVEPAWANGSNGRDRPAGFNRCDRSDGCERRDRDAGRPQDIGNEPSLFRSKRARRRVGTPQEIVAIADLPEGKYIFTTEVFNGDYETQSGFHFEAIFCTIKLNGQSVDLPSAGGLHGFVVGDEQGDFERRYFTDTVALTVPDLSAIRLACRLFGVPGRRDAWRWANHRAQGERDQLTEIPLGGGHTGRPRGVSELEVRRGAAGRALRGGKP